MDFKLWMENQSLPAVLYHVTTAGGDIDKFGFQTADQHGKGTVLGGSFSHAVSFTSSLKRAQYYQTALEMTQEILYENLLDDKQRLWMQARKFNPDYDKFKHLLEFINREPKEKAVEYFLLYFGSVTEGRFPAIFGGGIRSRVKPDSTVSTIKVSTLAGKNKPGPQKWTANPQEEEFRIYDPENIDGSTIEFI